MNSKGFVLLFAVLISSILLSVGLALSNISYKEIILSAAGRDSQLAFFGADSGAECAFYWDRKWLDHGMPTSPFPENNDFNAPDGPAGGPGGNPPVAPWDGMKCNDRVMTNTSVSGWSVVADVNSATTTFTLRLGSTDKEGCVTVTVAKDLPATHVLPDVKITSVGASSCSLTDPRVVERTIESSIPGF